MYLLADKVVPSLDDMLSALDGLREDKVLPAGMRRLATAALEAAPKWEEDFDYLMAADLDGVNDTDEGSERLDRGGII